MMPKPTLTAPDLVSDRQAGGSPGFTPHNLSPRRPTPDQIRVQLARLLKDPTFSASERTRNFLKYVVEQTLAGNAKRLKQYTIAVEILGRGSGFNPETDPVVRLEAGKLRRELENYYLRAGFRDEVRISVPKGGYVPVFHFGDVAAVDAAPSRVAGPAATERSPRFCSDTQRVIVLPLSAHLQDEECRPLAEGLFEQLVVELARYTDLAVIPANGSDPAEPLAGPLAPEVDLGAKFVVSGSVRQSGEAVRTTIRLHELATRSILWSESFDSDLASARRLNSLDQMARAAAGAIADYYGVISHKLALDAIEAASGGWTLQKAILRHRYMARSLTEKIYRLARPDLEFAVQHAPHHPMAWAALAHTIFYANVLGFDEDPDWMALVYRYTQRSFELDHRCAFGHVVMALHDLYRRDFEDVLETCDRIMEQNPHAPSTVLSAGFFRALAGDWNTGTAMLTSAHGRLVHPPAWACRVTFLNHYRQKDYGRALHETKKYHAPDHLTPPLLRAAALAQLGRIEEAKLARAEVLRICPGFQSVADRYFRYLVPADELNDHLKTGLSKAGFTL